VPATSTPTRFAFSFKLNYENSQECSEDKEIKEKSLNNEGGFTFENPQFLFNEPGLDLLEVPTVCSPAPQTSAHLQRDTILAGTCLYYTLM
jgi:hypothetical protein